MTHADWSRWAAALGPTLSSGVWAYPSRGRRGLLIVIPHHTPDADKSLAYLRQFFYVVGIDEAYDSVLSVTAPDAARRLPVDLFLTQRHDFKNGVYGGVQLERTHWHCALLVPDAYTRPGVMAPGWSERRYDVLLPHRYGHNKGWDQFFEIAPALRGLRVRVHVHNYGRASALGDVRTFEKMQEMTQVRVVSCANGFEFSAGLLTPEEMARDLYCESRFVLTMAPESGSRVAFDALACGCVNVRLPGAHMLAADWHIDNMVTVTDGAALRYYVENWRTKRPDQKIATVGWFGQADASRRLREVCECALGVEFDNWHERDSLSYAVEPHLFHRFLGEVRRFDQADEDAVAVCSL